jgi:hypothetical protein
LVLARRLLHASIRAAPARPGVFGIVRIIGIGAIRWLKAMRVAILFTAYRQLPELDLQAEFFRRSGRLRNDVDIVYHCNNASVSTEELKKKLDAIPCKSMTLLHHPCNAGGYAYGQFESIVDAWDTVVAGGWDWVIHLHPDIFVVDDERLLAAIESAHAADADILVTRIFGNKAPAFATDFFAFRPGRTPKSVFASWEPFEKEPVIVPLENLYFVEVHKHRLETFVADRFKSGAYYQDPDHLGLWHEHKLNRAWAYLKRPNLRWRTTWWRLLRHPGSAIWTAFAWARRQRSGLQQDSMMKYLTRI